MATTLVDPNTGRTRTYDEHGYAIDGGPPSYRPEADVARRAEADRTSSEAAGFLGNVLELVFLLVCKLLYWIPVLLFRLIRWVVTLGRH